MPGEFLVGGSELEPLLRLCKSGMRLLVAQLRNLPAADAPRLDVVEDAALRKGDFSPAHAASTSTRQLLGRRIFAALGPPLS